MWKGKHNGQEVAAKALRVYQISDLKRIRRVRGARFVAFSNELTVSHIVVLQGGRDVENASSPECIAAFRCDGD